MRRIFTAVDISEEARQRAANYIGDLRREFPQLRVGWERPEKLHLTLKFLSDTGDDQLEELKLIVGKLAAETPPFLLEILGTGAFPSARNARVLWIDVRDETQSLAGLHARLEESCEKLGFAKENRRFTPHLTIARLREPQKSRALAESHLKNEFEPVGFEASGIVIYESRLRPTGSVYEKVLNSGFRGRT